MNEVLEAMLHELDALPEEKQQRIMRVLEDEVHKAKQAPVSASRRRLVDFIGSGKGIYKTRALADGYILKLREEWQS